ncbi:unnamed protein product [Caenorhabditis auriculariae]|uniref:Uncharacterized protein n=1 Tax=Caenorhabditis auriculariae TaxID=2777116 RepID=A0A8S1H5F4_9PELO|nr:unnamed protein product [Caenorhabditis auriculariae]
MMNLDNPAYLYKSLIERKMLLRRMVNNDNLLDFSIENRTRKQGILERLIKTSQERCDEYRSVHINEIVSSSPKFLPDLGSLVETRFSRRFSNSFRSLRKEDILLLWKELSHPQSAGKPKILTPIFIENSLNFAMSGRGANMEIEAVENNVKPVVASGQGVQNHNIDVEMEEIEAIKLDLMEIDDA